MRTLRMRPLITMSRIVFEELSLRYSLHLGYLSWKAFSTSVTMEKPKPEVHPSVMDFVS